MGYSSLNQDFLPLTAKNWMLRCQERESHQLANKLICPYGAYSQHEFLLDVRDSFSPITWGGVVGQRRTDSAQRRDQRLQMLILILPCSDCSLWISGNYFIPAGQNLLYLALSFPSPSKAAELQPSHHQSKTLHVE